MYLLKKHRWHITGLAATFLLSSCALIAPPGDGTEEDPFNRNTQDNSGETGSYPTPTGDYSSPTDTTVGYPPPATGGEYSVPPPVTDTYSPPPVAGNYPPPSGGYSPPPTTPYYPPPSSSVGSGSGNYHTVQPGENLYRISKNYGSRYQDVAALNNIPPPYNISVGQRILIRGGMSTIPSAPSSSNASYHTIQRGENLYRISLKYGCTVADIARWNGLSTADYSDLKVGQRLRVSAGVSSSSRSRSPATPPRTSTPATSSSNFHVVGPTETLTTIANSYGLTVYELALWNGISSPYTVYPGQRLLIVPP